MYPNPPLQADERETLVEFLNYNRAVMVDKAGGLTPSQLRKPHPPSTLTIIGLVYHLALAETHWFHSRFAGNDRGWPWSELEWEDDPDAEFTAARSLQIDDVVAVYEAAVTRSNAIVAAAPSLDALSEKVDPVSGDHWSLRWIIAHMIEETARHAGHADMIRESLDGATGDFRANG